MGKTEAPQPIRKPDEFDRIDCAHFDSCLKANKIECKTYKNCSRFKPTIICSKCNHFVYVKKLDLYVCDCGFPYKFYLDEKDKIHNSCSSFIKKIKIVKRQLNRYDILLGKESSSIEPTCEICHKKDTVKYRENVYNVQKYTGIDQKNNIKGEKILHWLCDEHFHECSMDTLDAMGLPPKPQPREGHKGF